MMSEHRFCVGQNVRLITRYPRLSAGRYEIEKLMPFDGSCFEYRIKSIDEQFFRMAKEHELSEEGLAAARQDK